MSKVYFIFCLFLAVSLSKTAPVLDEEVDDDYENNDDTQDEEKSNENDDDYNDAKAKDDDYDDEEEGNVKRKEDEQEDDEEDDEKDDDDEVEVVEQDRKRKTQYLDEDEDIEEGESKGGTLDDQTVDAAAGVVEDSEGKMAMDKKPGHTDDEDEADGDDESDGAEFQDMGKQISKLKKVFNEDMPNEIEELKSNNKRLKDDLDKLNGKLEKFLRDNGIKQGTSVPKSSEDYDYEA